MLPGVRRGGSRAHRRRARRARTCVIATVETESDIAELVRELVESGAGVIDVRRHTADLESIFRGAA